MIYCSDARCKYCDDNYKCTNKKVQLDFCGVHTRYKGFQHYLKCKSFEESSSERRIFCISLNVI